MNLRKGKLSRKILPIVTFVPIDVKRLFRDKVAIFFTFVFPLIFLFVFGGIFNNTDEISFQVALINRSDSEFATNFVKEAKENKVLDINEEVNTLDQAREKMNRGEISAAIILPKDFGAIKNQKFPSGQAEVLYDQNDQQAGQTLSSILEAQFKEINKQFVQIQEPFSVEARSTATKGLSQFDFIFSGLLGFVILTLGIFGPTTVFPRLKQRGVLRRYHTTTLRVWQYFTSNVISNSIAGILSIVVMFIMARLVFNLEMRGDYLSLIAVIVIGITLLFGIGMAVGGWAKNENQAAPLANLLAFPMMFLSGVFFPTFLMPLWLQNITQFIPLTPVINSLRLIITEGKTIFDLGPDLAVIGVWIIVVYFIAFRVFRWE